MLSIALIAIASVSLYAGTQDPSGSSPEVSAIYEQTLAGLNRIDTLKYEFRATTDPRDAKAPNYKCAIAIKNKMFHNSSEVASPELKEPLKQIMAYDGERYQSLNEDGSFLGESRAVATERPYFLFQPVNEMFEFAYGDKELRDLETLRQKARWADLASRSRRTEAKKVGEWDCEVLSIAPSPNSKAATTVALAKALDYYPVEMTRTDEQGASHRQVLQVQILETSKGRIVIPTKFQMSITPKGVSTTTNLTTEIVPGSLQANIDLPDSMFTIPKSQASIAFDIDKKQTYREGRLVPTKPKLLDVTPWYARTANWLMVVSGIAVVAALVVFIRRKSNV